MKKKNLRTTLHYFVCQVRTICLKWQKGDCCLPRWGPAFNVHWKVCVMAVKLSVWTLLMERCPQALGSRWGRNVEEGVSFLFRCYETGMLLSVVAKRDGGVYVVGCEYFRVPDACIFSSTLVALPSLTLCDCMDCSPLGSSVHGIFQASRWKRVVISSSHLMHWQADSLQH